MLRRVSIVAVLLVALTCLGSVASADPVNNGLKFPKSSGLVFPSFSGLKLPTLVVACSRVGLNAACGKG